MKMKYLWIIATISWTILYFVGLANGENTREVLILALLTTMLTKLEE